MSRASTHISPCSTTRANAGPGRWCRGPGRLWVVTYAPHKPTGSTDKLYEITPTLEAITRPESIGGTPANRMIHRESEQLFIGPYAIRADRIGAGDSVRENVWPPHGARAPSD